MNSLHCSHCVLFSCCFMHFWWFCCCFLPCSGPLVNQAAFDRHTASSMLSKVQLGFRSSNSTALFYCSLVYITCPKSKVFPTADDGLCCAKYSNSVVFLSSNIVLDQTCQRNVKLRGAGNSCDWLVRVYLQDAKIMIEIRLTV